MADYDVEIRVRRDGTERAALGFHVTSEEMLSGEAHKRRLDILAKSIGKTMDKMENAS